MEKISIRLKENENLDFIEILETITNELIEKYDVGEINLVKVKNWFDNKWLNYSGKGIVEFNSGGIYKNDVALEPKWNEKITIPPFNPNRILSDLYYVRIETENKNLLKPTHIIQNSSKNLNNRIVSKSTNAIYIWYSSNTEINQKGCIMVYHIKNESVKTWYASIENINGWKITKVKGIEVTELSQLLERKNNR